MVMDVRMFKKVRLIGILVVSSFFFVSFTSMGKNHGDLVVADKQPGDFPAISNAVLAHKGAMGVVKLRMNIMKVYAKNMKSIFSITRQWGADSADKIDAVIKSFYSQETDFSILFPVGSHGGVSEASLKIWEKPGEFKSASDEFWQAIKVLDEARVKNNKAAVVDSFRKLGSSCKNCHKNFREKIN